MLLGGSLLIGAYQIVHVDVDVLHPVRRSRQGGGSLVDLGRGRVYGKGRGRIQCIGSRIVCGGI